MKNILEAKNLYDAIKSTNAGFHAVIVSDVLYESCSLKENQRKELLKVQHYLEEQARTELMESLPEWAKELLQPNK